MSLSENLNSVVKLGEFNPFTIKEDNAPTGVTASKDKRFDFLDFLLPELPLKGVAHP